MVFVFGVSDSGVECDLDMVSPVMEWTTPDNLKKLQSFLSFANFCRWIIKVFLLTCSHCRYSYFSSRHQGKKGQKKSEKKKGAPKEWTWDSKEDEAVAALKAAQCYHIQTLLSHSWLRHFTSVLKSDKIGVLLNIFMNKATSTCFVNLIPIFTIFSIPVNIEIVHMSHHFGSQGNNVGGNLCVTIVTNL